MATTYDDTPPVTIRCLFEMLAGGPGRRGEYRRKSFDVHCRTELPPLDFMHVAFSGSPVVPFYPFLGEGSPLK